MSWLQKVPIVSLLFAVAIAVVPFWITSADGESLEHFETSRERARTFLVRNPQLQVDARGALILDPAWLEEMRSAAANADSAAQVELPARMLARSQARLDGLITSAYEHRIKGDVAWRMGVLDARSPTENYFVHAFVHEHTAGMILGAIVMLLVGAALELSWGSLVFAVFTMAAIPMTALGYRFLDASSGLPWSGAAGLAGALLGAYFIRGLGGRFMVPGWILLPAWLAAETFLVRGFWIDDLGSVPWATFCAAVGMGALISGALRLANIESKIASHSSKNGNRAPNPVVMRAARLRSDGDPYQAFDLIQAAWRDDPTSDEIAETFYSIAVEVGQPEVAAEAIVPRLRSALRQGDVSQAVDYWLPLATKECDVSLDATVAVRLGEALLDAGHPTEALSTLNRALDIGVSAAQATRIVSIARDLDEGLARSAAIVALNDASLDPRTRAELEPLASSPSDAPPVEEAPPTPAPKADNESELGRRVHAEHQSVETTAFPIDADTDITDTTDAVPADPNEASLQAQELDAGAFSAENFASAPSDDEGSSDVLSHWGDRDLLGDDTTDDLGADLPLDDGDEPFLDASALETQDEGIDFGLDLADSDLGDALDTETDTDLTPLIDATDEQTSPLLETDLGDAADSDAATTDVFEQKTAFFDVPVSPPGEQKLSIGRVELTSNPAAREAAGGAPDGSLRTLKAIEAAPIAMTDEGIEIDVSDRGKSTVPFTRIQTISMAAVENLGKRPVLIIDVVLNGSDSIDEPMKLIRFRSDRFDPLSFEPSAANPLAALVVWVGRLQGCSNAICIPSEEILDGKFARFDSLEAYEQNVLSASRDDGA